MKFTKAAVILLSFFLLFCAGQCCRADHVARYEVTRSPQRVCRSYDGPLVSYAVNRPAYVRIATRRTLHVVGSAGVGTAHFVRRVRCGRCCR